MTPESIQASWYPTNSSCCCPWRIEDDRAVCPTRRDPTHEPCTADSAPADPAMTACGSRGADVHARKKMSPRPLTTLVRYRIIPAIARGRTGRKATARGLSSCSARSWGEAGRATIDKGVRRSTRAARRPIALWAVTAPPRITEPTATSAPLASFGRRCASLRAHLCCSRARLRRRPGGVAGLRAPRGRHHRQDEGRDRGPRAARRSTARPETGLPTRGVALSLDGLRAYVVSSNGSAGRLSVIDLQTRAIVAQIGVPAGARGVALSADGARAYVTSGQPRRAPVDREPDHGRRGRRDRDAAAPGRGRAVARRRTRLRAERLAQARGGRPAWRCAR